MAITSQPVDEDLTRLPSLAQLRTLSGIECVELADDIRRLIITHVSRTGGHLGANLSTIELTIALHRAFDSPGTKIVWDTGHQSYTHKLLTGRAMGFLELRSRHGMSGFPSRAESDHDVLENSHASVGPGWALGIAIAVHGKAVVVLGDGALTGGVAYEALNAIGFAQAPVTVILNDNGRSYSATPSLLTYGEPSGNVLSSGVGARDFFESLGFSYHGPVDGHDFPALEENLGVAARRMTPTVVHVRTQKGHGWPPAIFDDTKRLHDVGPGFSPTTAPSTAPPDWSTVVGGLLCDIAGKDPRVHAITAAMPDTVGLREFAARFPDRYHDLGIAEQSCVAVASGLASQGRRPFFAVVTTFLTRALDQVLNDVALHNLPVVLLLDRAGVTGPDGASHHGAYDVSFLRAIPNISIYSPSTVADVADLFGALLDTEHGPVAIRYPKGRPTATGNGAVERTGLIRGGGDACLVAHGPTATIALQAAEMLAEREGVECAVWRLHRIHPLDQALVSYATHQPLLIPVEEVSPSGSLALPLAFALSSISKTVIPVHPLTLPAGFLPHGSRDELLREFGLTAQGISDFVLKTLNLAR